MAKYRISAPNGARYEISAPDDASEADVMAYAQQQLAGRPAAAADDAPAPTTRARRPLSDLPLPIKDGSGGVKWMTPDQLGLPPDVSGLPRVNGPQQNYAPPRQGARQRLSDLPLPIKDGAGGVKWMTPQQLGLPDDFSDLPRLNDPTRGLMSGPSGSYARRPVSNGGDGSSPPPTDDLVARPGGLDGYRFTNLPNIMSPQGEGSGESLVRLMAAAAPNQTPTGTATPTPSVQPGGGASQNVYGDVSNFEVVGRNPAGGAGVGGAYGHWFGGTGKAQDIDFSGANVSGLKTIIQDSAAGKLQGTFRNAINESLGKQGLPVLVDTPAAVDTGGVVIGRDMTNLKGWVTAKDGKWQFEGFATGKPERFDFNRDPKRGPVKDAVTGVVGAVGHALGAKDYNANYVGSIQLKAGGNIRQ